MSRLMDAQTCGSLAVFSAFGASEGAAYYLNAYPASPFAWYLNLELFRPFQAAHAAECPLHLLLGANALALCVVLVLIVSARMARSRFAVALFANLALIAVAMLAHAWFWPQRHSALASLTTIDLNRDSDLFLVGLCAAALTACASSHLSFAIAIVQRGELTGRRREGRVGYAAREMGADMACGSRLGSGAPVADAS